MTKTAAHFVDSDISGTSGLDDWSSNNYEYPPINEAKIQIRTATELQALTSNLDGDYELIADIDLDGIVWTPIGNVTNKFTGSLDGRYHTISNLSLLKDDSATSVDLGIFGYLSSGKISNVNLFNFEISGRDSIGGLCGHFTGNTDFTNCTIDTITITGTELNSGTYLLRHAGGLVGEAEGGIGGSLYLRCSARNVSLRAEKYSLVGGLKGTVTDATDCYAQGAFVAWNWALDQPSTWTNNGSNSIGGFTGSASITDYVRCYAAVVMPPLIKISSNDGGGFCGVAIGGNFTDCFWDEDVAGINLGAGDQSGVVGLTSGTTEEMYQEATFTNWDFAAITGIWQIDEGNDYPVHQWHDITPDKIKTGEQNRTTAMPTDHAHLNGETVQVLGDGSYLGTDVVANGEIDLDDATAINHVGLAYTSTILPSKIDGEATVKRISKIIPNVNETVGGDYGRSEAKLTSMVLKDSGDPLDPDSDLFTGHVDLPFDGEYARNADIYITQDEPLPMNLLGIGVLGENIDKAEPVGVPSVANRAIIPSTDNKRALSIILNMNNSIKGDYGVDEDNTFSIDDDNEDLFTGHKELAMDDGYEKFIDVYVEQDQPLPMTVIGLGVNIGG